MWYMYTMEYNSVKKKKKKNSKVIPFAATCMQLEIITLNEVNQKDKEKYHMISLMCEV